MKNRKYFIGIISFMAAFLMVMGIEKKVYASEGEKQITITIDASDESSGLLYAIDSMEPEAFGQSNTFTIAEGSTHIIYVKDEAGNITSQTYTHKISNQENEEGEEINIELELGNTATPSSSKKDTVDYTNYEYMTDTKVDNSQASVISKITTDGSDNAEKVFYTITTEEGEEFYLIIEQGTSNKVYLLNTVTLDDLAVLAVDGGSESGTKKQEDNLLEALAGNNSQNNESESETIDNSQNTKKSSNLYFYIVLVVVCAAYYYFKIYKNKKNESMDEMDAMDMDDFSMEEENEEEEELNFSDKEKQELLDKLLNGDDMAEREDELQNMEPEEYVSGFADTSHATSHIDEINEYLVENECEEFDPDLDGEEEDE